MTPSPLRRGASALARAALDLLSPPCCASCQASLPETRPGDPFCPRCELAVAPRDPEACVACERLVAGEGLCHRCHARLAPLAGVTSTFDYDGPVAQGLKRLKYDSREDLAGPLAARWLRELDLAEARARFATALVAPVPLHPRRLAARGFDQAWLLAQALGRALGLQTSPRALRRQRATRPQVGLGRKAREENVRDAFEASPAVAGRQLLLIDDVLTTGATLHACALAARRAGATSVSALTFARASA